MGDQLRNNYKGDNYEYLCMLFRSKYVIARSESSIQYDKPKLFWKVEQLK